MLKKILPKAFLFMVALVTVLILPVNAIAGSGLQVPTKIITFGAFSAPAKHQDPYRAIDNNENTKMLNFAKEGNGFTVTFEEAVVVNEIEFTTANDDYGRDPTGVEIWGSNQSPQSGFSKIANVPLTRATARYSPYGKDFKNQTAYKYYRVVITSIHQSSANSYQFAEVSFYGTGATSTPPMGDPNMPPPMGDPNMPPPMGDPNMPPPMGDPGMAAELTGVDYGCGDPIINTHDYCLNNWSKKPWQGCLDWARGKTNPESQEFERTKCQCQHGEGRKWTGTGSGPDTGLFKDNCVQWSGETVYLDGVADEGGGPPPTGETEGDKKAVVETEVEQKRREVACLNIRNAGLDPDGHLKCIVQADCEEQGFTWINFDPSSTTRKPGCWAEENAPKVIEGRAKAVASAFIGERGVCSPVGAFQRNCPLKVDVAWCTSLTDLTGLTGDKLPPLAEPPQQTLGVLLDKTRKCQEVMNTCSATAWMVRTGEERRQPTKDVEWKKFAGDIMADYMIGKADDKLAKNNSTNKGETPIDDFVGYAMLGFFAGGSASKEDFIGAAEQFANFATKDAYACAKGLGEGLGGGMEQGFHKILDCQLAFINYLSGGLTGTMLEGIGILADSLSTPACVFDLDSHLQHPSTLSLEDTYNFDGPWGMFGRGFFFEHASEAELAHVRDCEIRHNVGATCHPTIGIAGRETAEAKERCSKDDKWMSLDSCPVDTTALDAIIMAFNKKYGYGYTNSQHKKISNPPNTDNHIWDGLTITGATPVPCDVPVIQLSANQLDQCESLYYGDDGCSNIVDMGIACINPDTGTPKWQKGVDTQKSTEHYHAINAWNGCILSSKIRGGRLPLSYCKLEWDAATKKAPYPPYPPR